MSQNSALALDYFTKQGWTPQQAAGIVGNLMQESGLNPAVAPGDAGKSHGIAQWNGDRLNALQDFAAQQGGDWHDLNTQLGFIQNELGGTESKAAQALKAAQNIPDATAAFAGFERPQGWTPSNPQGANAYDKRLQYAMQALGGDSAAMGVDAPSMTSSTQTLTQPPMASAAMVQDPFAQLQQTAQQGANPMQMLQDQAPSMPQQDTFDVEMPDGTLVQDVPRGTTKAQLQKLLASNTPAPKQEPRGTDYLRSLVQNDADTTYGNILPLKHNNQTGATALALPEMGRGAVRGLADLLDQMNGGVQQQSTDTQNMPLTDDAMGAIGMLAGGGGLEKAGVRKAIEEVPYNITKPNGKPALPSDKIMPLKNSMANEEPIVVQAVKAKGKEPVPTSDDIRAQASEAYKKADAEGGFISPENTNAFVEESGRVLPQTPEGQLIAGENTVSKIVKNIEGLRDKKLSFQSAQEIDEALGDHIDDFVDATTGKLTKQGKKLYDIQTSFRDTMAKTGEGQGFETLKTAQDLWARQARMREIEKIITRSEGMANPAQGMKTQLNTLLANPKRMRGFTPQERKLIEQARDGSLSDEALRLAGSRLNAIIGGATGHLGGAMAAHVVSIAARGGAQKIQLYRMNKILEAIAKGSKKGK